MLPTFTDEKLSDYLGVWDTLIAQGKRALLDITLVESYGCFAWPWERQYTLIYGEEKRELTLQQARHVYDWMNKVKSPILAGSKS